MRRVELLKGFQTLKFQAASAFGYIPTTKQIYSIGDKVCLLDALSYERIGRLFIAHLCENAGRSTII